MKLFAAACAGVCAAPATIFVLLAPANASAGGSRVESALKKLDPSSRLTQVCDLKAMEAIGRSSKDFRPDRAVVDAVSSPAVSNNTIKGKGGAFRSRGKWYQFSFTCSTSPDRMKVISFDYNVGDAIPEAKWSDYGLYR
ncbi:MAG: DUF930 domain-containing protein [Variibacter sp.]